MAVSTYVTIDGGNGQYPSATGVHYSGGEKTFALYATPGSSSDFHGATIKIQASFASDTHSESWINLNDSEGAELSFTENSIFKISLGQCKLRFVVSGSSGTTQVTIKVS